MERHPDIPLRKIDRTFAILEDILGCEFSDTGSTNYDISIGMKILSFGIIILLNLIYERQRRRIMDVVV